MYREPTSPIICAQGFGCVAGASDRSPINCATFSCRTKHKHYTIRVLVFKRNPDVCGFSRKLRRGRQPGRLGRGQGRGYSGIIVWEICRTPGTFTTVGGMIANAVCTAATATKKGVNNKPERRVHLGHVTHTTTLPAGVFMSQPTAAPTRLQVYHKCFSFTWCSCNTMYQVSYCI